MPILNERKVMSRADLTQRLVSKLTNEAVVAGIGYANWELWGTGQRPENFYMLGSMGLAFPIALGVAIAQPKRRVFALEGDGSLLMQLGVLGTIASRKPSNLTMIIWDNGAYQITGGQPTTTATMVDLVGVARASGLEHAHWAEDEKHFDSLVERSRTVDAPFFIAVKVDNKKPAGTTDRDPAVLRESFRRGLAAGQG